MKSTTFGNGYIERHLQSANYEVKVPRYGYGVIAKDNFDEVLEVLKSNTYFIEVEALGPIKMLLDHLANVVLIIMPG